jgi:hypothetical protein
MAANGLIEINSIPLRAKIVSTPSTMPPPKCTALFIMAGSWQGSSAATGHCGTSGKHRRTECQSDTQPRQGGSDGNSAGYDAQGVQQVRWHGQWQHGFSSSFRRIDVFLPRIMERGIR